MTQDSNSSSSSPTHAVCVPRAFIHLALLAEKRLQGLAPIPQDAPVMLAKRKGARKSA